MKKVKNLDECYLQSDFHINYSIEHTRGRTIARTNHIYNDNHVHRYNDEYNIFYHAIIFIHCIVSYNNVKNRCSMDIIDDVIQTEI